jgi:glycosyltransferase involved in cell wall biosynthesis
VKNKNISIIGPYKPQTGGPSSHIQELVSRLKQNNNVSIISIGDKKFHLFEGSDDNELQIYRDQYFYSKKYTLLQTLFLTTKRALKVNKSIDLYHSHGTFFSGIGFFDKKKPLVLTVHGYGSLETIFNGRIKSNSIGFKLLRKLEKLSVVRADAIISVGSKLENWIITELDANPEKVFVIPNGVDVNFFKFSFDANFEIRDKYNIGYDSPILLFTKHFSPRYGAQYLVPALKEIKKEYPSIKLIMTNEDKWKEGIINLAKEYGVIDNIVFAGRLLYEDLPKYYSACDIFIHPSINDQETFGISLIEAMACSKPVIATAVGGPKEIIEGGDNVGILISPENSEEIITSVINLLKNPSKADEIGRNARKYVELKYTWESVTEKIYEVYEYAINSGYKTKN